MAKNRGGKTKKQSVFAFAAALVLFTIAGVGLFVSEKDYLFGEAKDFYEMIEDDGGPVNGEHVKLEVDAVLDWYAETKHKISGFIPAGSEQHCVVWLDNNALISMTVKGKKNIAKVDKIIDSTNDYLNYAGGYSDEAVYLDEVIEFEGEITNIGYEVSGYYNDAMEWLGVSADSDITVYRVTIDTTSTKGSIWLMIGACVLFDVVFVAMIISNSKANKKAKHAAEG